MPELFKLCVATWAPFNPDWDVRVVDQESLYEYLSPAELPNRFAELASHQTASDCVRLALLARYGGVYMDVSIALRTSLDALCWDQVMSKKATAAVFFHPHFGTEAFDHEDFTESWFLATLPGNPFFLRWRDLLRELMHNRLNVDGLLAHPLYSGFDSSGIHRLNQKFGAPFDFREYLAIHSMARRLIETDARAQDQWRHKFVRLDAARTAFRLQLQAEANGQHAAAALVADGAADNALDGVPLVKLTTPHYSPLLALRKDQLLHRGHLLGRLLSPGASAGAPGAGARRQLWTAAAAGGRVCGRRGAATLTAAAAAAVAGAGNAVLRSGIGAVGQVPRGS